MDSTRNATDERKNKQVLLEQTYQELFTTTAKHGKDAQFKKFSMYDDESHIVISPSTRLND